MHRQNISGRQIGQLRSARTPRMTQASLARALQLKGFNIDRAGIAKIECGFRKVSDVELAAISEILDVPSGDLLRDTDQVSNRLPRRQHPK